jgi:arsenate reductase-like glutaredoxin family protein
MEVQIFGLKKSADTRKALRFFAERRIRTHFVDLTERDIAEGELQRFVSRFGIEAVMDRGSKRFEQLGLKHSTMSEGRWMDKLLVDAGLLKLPLIRRLGAANALTVGDAESDWKEWISNDRITPSKQQ